MELIMQLSDTFYIGFNDVQSAGVACQLLTDRFNTVYKYEDGI